MATTKLLGRTRRSWGSMKPKASVNKKLGKAKADKALSISRKF